MYESRHVIFRVPLASGHHLTLAETGRGRRLCILEDDEVVPNCQWAASDLAPAVAKFRELTAARDAARAVARGPVTRSLPARRHLLEDRAGGDLGHAEPLGGG